MQLYPLYFDLIMRGVKTFEGRAYKPGSGKNYPGVCPGDVLQFSICKEIKGWESQCDAYSIHPDSLMSAQIVSVHYAPLVQLAFHDLEPAAGERFQSILSHVHDRVSTAIVRAARYYEIPEYPDLIRKHGFLGLELGDVLVGGG